jgi:hypothetical protein
LRTWVLQLISRLQCTPSTYRSLPSRFALCLFCETIGGNLACRPSHQPDNHETAYHIFVAAARSLRGRSRKGNPNGWTKRQKRTTQESLRLLPRQSHPPLPPPPNSRRHPPLPMLAPKLRLPRLPPRRRNPANRTLRLMAPARGKPTASVSAIKLPAPPPETPSPDVNMVPGARSRWSSQDHASAPGTSEIRFHRIQSNVGHAHTQPSGVPQTLVCGLNCSSGYPLFRTITRL